MMSKAPTHMYFLPCLSGPECSEDYFTCESGIAILVPSRFVVQKIGNVKGEKVNNIRVGEIFTGSSDLNGFLNSICTLLTSTAQGFCFVKLAKKYEAESSDQLSQAS